jgi:hypothetical protein
VTSETWDTVEKIHAARARFEEQMPGWVPPAAFGVVLVPEDKLGSTDVTFPVVSANTLPAVVLGRVTGRTSETATYELSAAELSEAIALAAPAQAATMIPHPNIVAWRAISGQLAADPSARVFAVFVADLDDPPSSPYDVALRAQRQ